MEMKSALCMKVNINIKQTANDLNNRNSRNEQWEQNAGKVIANDWKSYSKWLEKLKSQSR